MGGRGCWPEGEGELMADTEFPLHVQVALALGWTWWKHSDEIRSHHPGARFLRQPNPPAFYGFEPADGTEALAQHDDKTYADWVPRYDTDWAVTGPLITLYGIELYRRDVGTGSPFWKALVCGHAGNDDDPLIAVCGAIIEAAGAGHLLTVAEQER